MFSLLGMQSLRLSLRHAGILREGLSSWVLTGDSSATKLENHGHRIIQVISWNNFVLIVWKRKHKFSCQSFGITNKQSAQPLSFLDKVVSVVNSIFSISDGKSVYRHWKVVTLYFVSNVHQLTLWNFIDLFKVIASVSKKWDNTLHQGQLYQRLEII